MVLYAFTTALSFIMKNIHDSAENEQFFLNLVNEGFYILKRDGTIYNGASGKQLSTSKKRKSYYTVSKRIVGADEIKSILLHRLLYLYFVGPIENGNVIHHKNDDIHDNNIDNLESVTQEENVSLAWKSGIHSARKPKEEQTGSKSPNAVFTADQVIEMVDLYNTGTISYNDLSKKYGVTIKTIMKAIRGITYKDVPADRKINTNVAFINYDSENIFLEMVEQNLLIIKITGEIYNNKGKRKDKKCDGYRLVALTKKQNTKIDDGSPFSFSCSWWDTLSRKTYCESHRW